MRILSLTSDSFPIILSACSDARGIGLMDWLFGVSIHWVEAASVDDDLLAIEVLDRCPRIYLRLVLPRPLTV